MKDHSLFIQKVLSWYKVHGRHDLPWRKNINPYRILVSELMLQQTQVSRVLPKYKAWMKVYPTLTSLSSASLQGVLTLWKGLGYQRRVKALLLIAKQTTTLPRTYDELLILPGIGKYTASAIMSFAYDDKSSMIETNIRTALIESFYKNRKEISDITLTKLLEQFLENATVRKVGSRVWYYALMDYGAELKKSGISHNIKVKGYRTQTRYAGSFRKLRAEVLFAISEQKSLPKDTRLQEVLTILMKEGFIKKVHKRGWQLQ